jgi:hypothetical protein
MQHNGHEYEIQFCDPKKDWGKYARMFHIKCAISDAGFYQTFVEAEAKAKSNIDNFVARVPQTKQQWLDAMAECLIWTAYEDCHLDEAMVWDLLEKAATHLKPNKVLSKST